jgi:hypothetical protein
MRTQRALRATIVGMISSGEAAGAEAGAEGTGRLGESRWPPALALVVFIGLNIALRVWLPNEGAVRVVWLVPAVEAALLVLLLLSDPGNLAKHHMVLRRLAVAMVVVLVVAALWATVLLVYDLVRGIGVTQSATRLLASGALIWLGNNLSFAMLYWLMDSGGPLARSRLEVPVDFASTQQMSTAWRSSRRRTATWRTERPRACSVGSLVRVLRRLRRGGRLRLEPVCLLGGREPVLRHRATPRTRARTPAGSGAGRSRRASGGRTSVRRPTG